MKILFLTDGIYPFQLGGMQKHSLILSGLLAERDVRMHLYHCGGEGYSPEAFLENYGSERSNIKEFMIPFPEKGKMPGHYIRENKEYSRLLYESAVESINEFDLVYAQGFTGWHFIKQKRKGEISLPILVNFHGLEMFQAPANLKAKVEQRFFRKAVRYNLLNADGVYSFGGHIDDLLKVVGVSEDRILIHSNGIEERWLTDKLPNTVRNQKRTITFIGRYERRKGVEELNEALNNLIRREDLSFVFNFIGPIPEEAKIKDERIRYHGEIRNFETIRTVLMNSDCLICPSHSEGMPTVILEAMACGLAIIATDVGAVSRQVKDNGILLSTPDPELIRKAVLRIIEMNDNDLTRMKSNSIEYVKKEFLWDVIADKKIAQFNRILANTK
ncbi:MAG: glycosyltransferase family 4 protein [Crocinitomicaceae bacterium]|nr:glycosyltransferase family 4 protein [Crocinitomicaceae bacterium]